MPLLLDLLEASGELDDEQLRGKSTTKAGPLLRSSIKIRKAGGRDRG